MDINLHKGKVFFLKIILSLCFGVACLLTPVFREGSRELLEIWRLPVGIVVFYVIVGLLVKAADKLNQRNYYGSSEGNLRAFIFCSAVGIIIGIFYLSVFIPGQVCMIH